jgi:hypothetical protein
MLVFSQTSLQRHRISPETPRAIYFNDDVYVGFCVSGDVIEISAADSKLGTVFYTLDQRDGEQPRIVRQTDSCLACHSSSRTEGVPGHLVRSLFVDGDGQPFFAAGSHTVDYTTPLKDRWGGWYVTGKHGDQTHLGNLIIREKDVPREIDNSDGHNIVSLEGRLETAPYFSPHSDIVALMVLEHQTLVHNRITKASFTARQALHYQQEFNEALGEPIDRQLDSTTRRIQNAGDDLVEALLFVDEAELTAPVSGTSGFTEQFESVGPCDSLGRSLRDLDLRQRLFTHPCSYLIYSEAFCELPVEMREYVWEKLRRVLVEAEDPEKFRHLTAEDRRAIVEILLATHPAIPESWRSDASSSAAQ